MGPQLQQHAALALYRRPGTGPPLQNWGVSALRGAFIGEAPLAIAIVMDNTRRPQLDAGRALQQMELVAWSEGLGTCFVGIRGEQQDEVKNLLGIPGEMELVTVLPFGYRAEVARAPGTPRKAMSEITHGERFGQSLVIG